jgi:glycosyltransferase involved in cell wall biosynthesis
VKLSVVTPSFNQLDWLELCIASVADQRGVEFIEHIVCDGQSEGIEDFEKRMLAQFPETTKYRLEFIVGPDAGMYDAINKGLRRASGDLCSYLNCDEQLLPGSLATVGDYFTTHAGTDVIFGDTIVVGREGEPLCYWRPYVPSVAHLAGATLNTLSCSTFFRRSVIEAGHLFEPQWKVVGDLRWIRGMLEKGRPMACLPKPLAAFTFLGDNLGAGATAREEFEASRESSGGPLRWFRRGLHGIRKLFSGAYVQRKVTYDLFALSDPTRRRRFTSESLGWTWPGLTKSR